VENLAQLEAAAPVALGDLAARILRDASPRAGERGVDLSLDVRAGTQVQGSEGLLAIAVQNLLDNAIRHARDHGAVNIDIACRGGRVELAVTDDGAGFADDQLPLLGQRFHRPEGSADGGSGLGLSIAHAIASLHGGGIVLGRSPAGGGRAVLSLPLTGPAHRQ
jgi:signal transduction histidine kinase